MMLKKYWLDWETDRNLGLCIMTHTTLTPAYYKLLPSLFSIETGGRTPPSIRG